MNYIWFNTARCKVVNLETKYTPYTYIIELVLENHDLGKNIRSLKITASTGILSAVLWLNWIIQRLQEEDYEVEGACAHFIINCDSACSKLIFTLHKNMKYWKDFKVF